MKVLWFEVTCPSSYDEEGKPVCGWQDALEHIIKGIADIDLHIAFETKYPSDERIKKGVTYHPLYTSYSWWELRKVRWDWDINAKKIVKESLKLIERIHPDIIHVFGNEWPFGLIAEHTNIPVVIHIQGSIVAYNNAFYPPGYNDYTMIRGCNFNLYKCWLLWKSIKYRNSRLVMEERTWKCVHHYMGRTVWDRALVNTLSPTSTYHHVDEALRPSFLATTKTWKPIKNSRINLITTGISSFWKGPDMLLKTARILKQNGIDFEWKVAGVILDEQKRVIEKKEGTTFEENSINVLGFIKPDELIEVLCSSTMYVHTAYIENSPNSICEAQYLGVPIVSTHVGGIETLLDAGKDGFLIPANDPWRMADAIIQLSEDEARLKEYSKNSYEHAHKRHNPENIKRDLLVCYRDVINSLNN